MLSDAALVALLKTLKSPDLLPGEYHVDEVITVRIVGSVNKSPDEVYTPTVDIPVKGVLAALLERAGITREASQQMLLDAINDALRHGTKADAKIKDRLNDIDEAMERVQRLTTSLVKKTRKGKTFADAEVQVVQQPKKDAA
jgi:hypothetical protein